MRKHHEAEGFRRTGTSVGANSPSSYNDDSQYRDLAISTSGPTPTYSKPKSKNKQKKIIVTSNNYERSPTKVEFVTVPRNEHIIYQRTLEKEKAPVIKITIPSPKEWFKKDKKQKKEKNEKNQESSSCNMMNNYNSKYCNICNSSITPEMKFCGNCGCDLEKRFCPQCGKALTPGSNFCSNCGEPI